MTISLSAFQKLQLRCELLSKKCLLEPNRSMPIPHPASLPDWTGSPVLCLTQSAAISPSWLPVSDLMWATAVSLSSADSLDTGTFSHPRGKMFSNLKVQCVKCERFNGIWWGDRRMQLSEPNPQVSRCERAYGVPEVLCCLYLDACIYGNWI